MTELVLVVEGHGDVDAFPILVGKIGGWLELPLFTAKPIRCGGWGPIKKEGGLEKWLELAKSRPECKKVVLVVDLDDGCPIEAKESLKERVAAAAVTFDLEIEICFCVREYEAWLLSSLDSIEEKLEGDIVKDSSCSTENNSIIRDAKGRVRQFLTDGYSESSDQSFLTRGISPPVLYQRDRSFRRFVRAISGLSYVDLEAHVDDPN